MRLASLRRRGQVGTAASVRVRRQGHELDFVAHRQPLSLRSVIAAKRVQVDGRALGYVQLRSFSVASAPELSRALTSLQR
jgi:C-terminal processing protease CtpA/Prc